MNAQTAYNELVQKYTDYTTLGSVSGLLNWDMQVMMPPKGNAMRSNQLTLLSGILHDWITSPQIGALLTKIEAGQEQLTAEQRVNYSEILRDYRKATKVPKELVEELTRHQSLSHNAWVEARAAADFERFAPYLEKMVSLMAQQAECLGYQTTPLDALIDLFEPGGTVAMFTELFDQVKRASVPLLDRVTGSKVQADRGFLARAYPLHLQQRFSEDVIQAIGFDRDAGRLDVAVHPFCAGSYGDVRLTTRYNEHAPQQALFGTIHEAGHGMYEQGFLEQHHGTPLAEPLSYGIHESQSRMWENSIARSEPFWRHFFPRFRALFPEQTADATLEQFVLAVNHVERSLVRVEADELTYDLHIIVRFELERDLFAGTLAVADLPAAWNRKMESYLGVTPPDNGRQGVLQDVHWSAGMFGYFPSYSLGNIAAAQLWAALRRDVSAADQKIARGEFADILDWLRAKVHVHGRRFKRDELLKQATGKPLGVADYIDYLTDKFSILYNI